MLRSERASTTSAQRLRCIATRAALRDDPPEADELRDRAVVIRAAAAGTDGALATFRRLFPGLEIWTDHPSYREGVWRCVVDGEVDGPQYTAYEPRHLDFHTDMSRYWQPPEFTLIRCARPDAGGGGENLVLHVDDLVGELRARGRDDLVAMLEEPRPLHMDERHRNTPESRGLEHALVPLVVAGGRRTPSRVFDRHAATKGTHLELPAEDAARYDEVLRLCSSLPAATACVQLEQGDVLAFSNWRFLHARGACRASGRVTEIAMANVAAPEDEAA